MRKISYIGNSTRTKVTPWIIWKWVRLQNLSRLSEFHCTALLPLLCESDSFSFSRPWPQHSHFSNQGLCNAFFCGTECSSTFLRFFFFFLELQNYFFLYQQPQTREDKREGGGENFFLAHKNVKKRKIY